MANGDAKSKDVCLKIRHADEMLEQEIELLKIAGLDNLAEIETWTTIGTNAQLSYVTHGAFRYFGKFPPPIATYLIEKYTGENDWVYDLMSGSGTTGVESLLLNRRCLLNDLNPLCVLLAKVKTKKLDSNRMKEALNTVVERYRPLTVEEYNFVPVGLRNPDHYFLNETSDSLRGLKYAISQEPDESLREFLLVAFLACVRRVSRATTQQGRLFLDVATAEPEALPFFVKRAEILINGINNLPESGYTPEVENFDIKKGISGERKNTASLVILHPPYFNSYKYSSVNSLELAWLGEDRKAFNKSEIREFFKVGKAENAPKYIEDMVKTIECASSALSSNGRMALMIGDTRIKGDYIPITRSIIDRLNCDLSIEKVALRIPKYTEASWATSQRRGSSQIGIALCDFILVLKKK